jgi:hypothetical protein
MSVETQQEKLRKPLVDLDGDSQDGTSEGMRCPKCRSARVQSAAAAVCRGRIVSVRAGRVAGVGLEK